MKHYRQAQEPPHPHLASVHERGDIVTADIQNLRLSRSSPAALPRAIPTCHLLFLLPKPDSFFAHGSISSTKFN